MSGCPVCHGDRIVYTASPGIAIPCLECSSQDEFKRTLSERLGVDVDELGPVGLDAIATDISDNT